MEGSVRSRDSLAGNKKARISPDEKLRLVNEHAEKIVLARATVKEGNSPYPIM